MSASIAERLREIVCEHLDVQSARVTPDASLISDLGADSLDIVAIALAVEEAFAIEIQHEDYANLMSIADAAAYIEARAGAAGTAE